MSPLARIRERKVAQWAVAYLAGAWIVLQVIDVVGDKFGWSATVFRIAAVLLGVGFLAALVLAWFHGERGQQRVGGVEMAMLIGILVMAGAAVFLVRGGGAATDGGRGAAGGEVVARSIAVLPFESLSSDPENAYFAGGIHDELLTRLSKLGGLKVISRTSVMAYEGSNKTVPQIAQELGVATVLEGSVQRSGNRVRVQAQLIDARNEGHLWSETYDRELSDIFAIQTDIAQRIAGALQTTLSATERAALAGDLTDNPEAYDAYMRARALERSRSDDRLRTYEEAIRLHRRAVELDPDFALAYAWMSRLHGWIYWLNLDPSEARVEMQLAAAKRALALQPELPAAHMAMGYYHYWGRRDYEAALREFEIALRGAPGDTEIMGGIAFVQRRQGKYDSAIEILERVTELDPYNPNMFQQLGDTYHMVRRYEEAARAFDRALALEPGDPSSSAGKAELLLDWRGDLDGWRTFVGTARTDDSSPAFVYASLRRDFPAALREAQRAPALVQGYRRLVPRSLLVGQAHAWLGDRARARAAFTEALAVADSVLRVRRDDPRNHLARAFALAGLGRHEDARAAARRAMQLMPPSRDALLGAFIAEDAAAVLAQAGYPDEAIAEIRRLLEVPSELSVHDLRLEPIWDPLRKDPRFQALLNESG